MDDTRADIEAATQALRVLKVPMHPRDDYQHTGSPYGIATTARSEVWMARQTATGKIVVIKILGEQVERHVLGPADPTERSKRIDRTMTYFQREAMIWNQLQHQNIVPLIAFIPSYKSSVFPALISEYFENGDIRKYLRMKRPVTIRKKYELLLDVLRGLEYLHGSLDPATGKRFVHRDIKGGNILVNNDERALITDFGNAKFIGDDSNFISSLRYSLNWTPPEYLIDPQKFHHGYRTFGDMWSYGCTVIEVLLEKDPWEDLKEDVEDTIKYGILTQPEALQDAQYDGCWPLIAQCITKEPTNRITATTAIAIIQSMMGANETR